MQASLKLSLRAERGRPTHPTLFMDINDRLTGREEAGSYEDRHSHDVGNSTGEREGMKEA